MYPVALYLISYTHAVPSHIQNYTNAVLIGLIAISLLSTNTQQFASKEDNRVLKQEAVKAKQNRPITITY